MNKSIFAIAAMALLAVCSCTKERLQGVRQQACGTTLTMLAMPQEEAGKTTLDGRVLKWGKGEYVLLYYYDGKHNFVKSQDASANASEGKAEGTFSFSLSPASASSYVLGGLYPYQAVTRKDDPSSVQVRLPATQDATASSYDPSAFILLARPQEVDAMPTQWMAYFKRVVALNQLTLTGLKEAVSKVEIRAEGCHLCGERTFDLTAATAAPMQGGDLQICVRYASPLPAGNADIWFTSWGADVNAGETLTIKVYGATKTYTRTITAGTAGIRFEEGKLNRLSVSFQSVAGEPYALRDFARAFVSILDVWEATATETEKTVGSATFTGHYVPDDFRLTVAGVSCDRPALYDMALQGLGTLVDGGTLDSPIPASRGYAWGSDPYNEGAGNGGPFGNATVNLAFLQNYASRVLTYATNNNRWSNFCWYTNASGTASTLGTPQVSGYTGVCCLERNLLIMARFYKYLLDNDIQANIPATCATMALSSALYESSGDPVTPVTPEPEPVSVSMQTFATQFVKLLDVWKANTASSKTIGNVTVSGYYVPATYTCTVNGVTYNKTKAFDVACQGLDLLVGGADLRTLAIPSPRAYSWSQDPYNEATVNGGAFQNATVNLNFLRNMANRQQTYAGNNKVWANFCTYTDANGTASTMGTPQVSGYKGVCCLERGLLLMARFYKFLLDKGVYTNITSGCSSMSLASDLFQESGSTTPSTPTTQQYWSQYGVSPDGTKIMAIGRASASGELSKYGYTFYKSVFVRKCPHCGSNKLFWSIFWAGNETSNWGTFPATGLKEGGSAEGHIFCASCDADYSCILGREHVSNYKQLTRVSGPTSCTKADAYTLKNGKMKY
ncbi:MAG: hypothetical protein J5871_03195 [Bacteroidales bacterium]|nr:hypothetical protein [Bacteroidales bacterium]